MPDLPKRSSCCCGPSGGECKPVPPTAPRPGPSEPCLAGWTDTPAGPVPLLKTSLDPADRRGALKMRWGVGRDRYAVPPGLYGVGSPEPDSPVLVTANYKLTVDRLRAALAGLDAWVLILDTRGINVWCAAGKGTFGTEELLRRMEAVNLPLVVAHRKLIVPQLGAPGVAAHEVMKRSGFRVLYGPVRAEDLPGYLRAGGKATEAMRQVRFGFGDRVSLVSVELTQGLKPLAWVLAAVILLAAAASRPFTAGRAAELALAYGLWVVAAYLAASLLTLALLPWLPGRAFSLKGFWIGLGLSALCGLFFHAFPGLQANGWATAAWLVFLPAVSSFIAMNFTGSTPFTSLSGVHYEMRRAVPLQVLGAATALGLWITGVIVR